MFVTLVVFAVAVVTGCTREQKARALLSKDCVAPTTECAAEVTFNDKCCVTCKPKRAVLPSSCTAQQLTGCAAGAANLRACGDDETPKFENCCLSCKPGLPKACTDLGQKTSASLANLPVCTEGQQQVNRETCSLNCVRRQFNDTRLEMALDKLKSLKERVEEFKKVCDKDKVLECRASQEVCASPEEARFEGASCCASCVRTKCASVEDARSCREAKPKCDFTTTFPGKPEEGSCCGSCKVGRPEPTACESGKGCKATEVCVWRKNEQKTFAPVCRKRRTIRKVLKFLNKERRDAFKNLSQEGKAAWIAAAVEAHCSSVVGSPLCKDPEASADAEQVDVKTSEGDKPEEVIIEVEVPAAGDVKGRKRADSGDLISDALNDNSNVEVTTTDAPPATGAASHLAASVGLVVLMTLSLLF